MKYIIVRTPSGEAPILFPREFIHGWVASTLSPMPVVAAGFVRLAGGHPKCYGTSESLRISSRPGRDTDLVARSLGQAADEPG
jgi:hypothetical protein